MAMFLFWNLNKRPLLNQVATLCHEHKVDVLILAESELSQAALLQTLNSGQRPQLKLSPLDSPSRLSFFMRYPQRPFKRVYDDGRVAIRRLIPRSGQQVWKERGGRSPG
jgi:hypothetical protein